MMLKLFRLWPSFGFQSRQWFPSRDGISQLSNLEVEERWVARSKAPRDYNAATCSEKEN